jgi:hypothetical protein
MNQEPEWTPEFDEAFEQGIQEGMKRERALWELAKTSQEIEKPKPLTDEMVLSGAKALCHQQAKACNVDFSDQWRWYAESFMEDARMVLEAAHGIKEQP